MTHKERASKLARDMVYAYEVCATMKDLDGVVYAWTKQAEQAITAAVEEANAHIAELEELFKVNQRDIREAAQQALGYEQTIDALGAVRRLADRCKELEAQLAAVTRERDKTIEQCNGHFDKWQDATRKAETDAARLRNALIDLRGLVSSGLFKTACNVIDKALRPGEQPAESEGE